VGDVEAKHIRGDVEAKHMWCVIVHALATV
jgi:hypothetical protein